QPFSFQMNGVGSTNPAPIISGLSLSPDGSNFLFTVSATGGLTYGLEASSDLTPGSWLRYTNFVQIGPMQLITVPIDPNYPKRFFRIASP
ncbi:MAG TPA: hypothetical protein VG146_06345, partial [Verrucomicrobiae bacterium]|nr:hypothetical protein [Verrucomicrobiae bacterium]